MRVNLFGYVKVGDPLDPPPHIDQPTARLAGYGDELLSQGEIALDLPGVELRLIVDCITEAALPRDVRGAIDIADLNLEDGRELPLFITARQVDQSRVWRSPIFMRSEACSRPRVMSMDPRVRQNL